MHDKDEVFDAMADSQRRQLLTGLLSGGSQPVPQLSSVSRELLEANEGFLRDYLSGSREIDDAEKADIRTHHVHLPKLTGYGHVEWDQDAHVTTKGPKFEDVKPMLEFLEEHREDAPEIDAPVILRE